MDLSGQARVEQKYIKKVCTVEVGFSTIGFYSPAALTEITYCWLYRLHIVIVVCVGAGALSL